MIIRDLLTILERQTLPPLPADLAEGLTSGEASGQLESVAKKMIGMATEGEATEKLLTGTEKVLAGPDDTE